MPVFARCQKQNIGSPKTRVKIIALSYELKYFTPLTLYWDESYETVIGVEISRQLAKK